MEVTNLIISHYLSQKTTTHLQKHHIIEQAYAEEYAYCFEYLFDLILYNASLVLLGCIFHDIIGSLIYILCMSALKSVAGGFHASKRYICSILSYSLYFVILLLYKPMYINCSFIKENNRLYMEILYFIIALIIIIFSPVENISNTFSANERRKLKNCTIILFVFITIAFFSFKFATTDQYCFLIILCLFATMLNQIIGFFYNKTNIRRSK